MQTPPITVVLAEDNLFVREGVRALLAFEPDLEVVGVASDYQELVDRACELGPRVVVTDIRMPPSFQREGIEAAKEIRRRHPGTGVVILSQYDEPDYAISLLRDGAEGYAYLLKDRVAEGDQLARAVREVAAGRSVLDSKIVEALVRPMTDDGDLSDNEEALLRLVAEGKPIKAIAAIRQTTPADVADSVERLFVKLAQGLSTGNAGSLERLKMLHQAIVDRDEQGESLSRLLPGGVAEKLRREGQHIGEAQKLQVTVLISDIRGYSTIAERTDSSLLAQQLSSHRAEMSRALMAEDGTVMTFIGDAVMGVFGAPVPQPDHASHALAAAIAMHEAQSRLNERWTEAGLEPFGLGIGLATGEVAAALLGSEQRLEYTVIGDTVNVAQRIQQWARAGETVLTEATYLDLRDKVAAERLDRALVKGRKEPVSAYRLRG